MESDLAVRDAEADGISFERKVLFRADTGIARLALPFRLLREHLFATAFAAIDQPLFRKETQGFFIMAGAIALAVGRRIRRIHCGDSDIRLEAQPLHIGQNGRLIFRAVARTIMIFDPREHLPALSAGHPPNVDHVQHMAKVQITRQAGRKPGGHDC